MNKKIKIEIAIGIISFVVIIFGIIIYWCEKNKIGSMTDIPNIYFKMENQGRITKNSREDAYNLLKIQYDLWQSKNTKDCHYFDNCFEQSFSKNEKKKIALAYEVINTGTKNPSVSIGLLKGSSVDIPGIGTGYLENKNKLGLENTNWYWEIGSCETNKRIFIDAATGKPGLLHNYMYCGGTP